MVFPATGCMPSCGITRMLFGCTRSVAWSRSRIPRYKSGGGGPTPNYSYGFSMYKLQLRIFDVFDGAQPAHAFFNGAAKTTDGRLWFAGAGLLQMIDPAHLAGDMVPPPVHIEEIVADQKTFSPQEQLQIPP